MFPFSFFSITQIMKVVILSIRESLILFKRHSSDVAAKLIPGVLVKIDLWHILLFPSHSNFCTGLLSIVMLISVFCMFPTQRQLLSKILN